MIQIEKILREQTSELKEMFLQKTEEYSKSEFEASQVIMRRSEEEWCKYFGIESEIRNGRMTFPRNFHNTGRALTMSKLRNKAYSITYNGYEKFLEKNLLAAERHYDSSIVKLVTRLIEKAFTDENIVIENASLSAITGFEMRIKNTVTNKIVRCWTIIAEGSIQRPHYRFLVK